MEKIIFNIDPYTFTGSAIIIGLILIEEFSEAEQDSVGNWLQLVGQTLQTHASQVATLETNKSAPNNNQNNDIDTLKKAIRKIEKKLNAL